MSGKTSNRVIRCAVIGAGWWATSAHIPAILRHPSAQLLGIQTRDLERGRAIQADFEVPHLFKTADELLNLSELDAVVVSTPPSSHYMYARAALERGLHVLVEKPMSITAVEAYDLVNLAIHRECHLLISCPWHYTRHAQLARDLCQQGALGEIRMISMLMTNPVADLIKGHNTVPTHGKPYLRPEPGSYSDPAIAGGGQIFTQVSHAAAYVCYLTQQRPQEIFARFAYEGSVNDIYDVLNIQMDGGTLVSLASTGATPLCKRHFEVRVFGNRMVLAMELWKGTMEIYDIEADQRREISNLPSSEIYPDAAPVTNLIDCALGQQRNVSPGILGAMAMDIIEGACKSAATDQNVHCASVGRGARH